MRHSRPKRRLMRLIDVPFLVGDANLSEGGDSDFLRGGKNWSNVMHWATGVKYGNLPADALRELFLGYELYHLEGWDVFAEDALNDGAWMLQYTGHGGVNFGPNGRKYNSKLPKKIREQALRCALSMKLQGNVMKVIDKVALDAPKTKLLAAKFKAMGLDSVMVIADEIDDNLALASRNLANVLVVEPRYADPLSLVFYKKVLVTKGAIEQLKEMYA